MHVLMFFSLLRLLRFGFFLRLCRYRAPLWLLRCVRQNYRLNIPVIIGSLITSRRPDYSRLMLRVLSALPDDEREAHEELRGLFICDSLHASSVSDGLAVCQSAITLCFRA